MRHKTKEQDPNDPMVVLARIALQEQAEKMEERSNKRRSRELALQQIHKTETDQRRKQEKFQSLCDHLLGNHRIGVNPTIRRCALHKDYLSDKSVRIYCSKCRFEWRPGDKATVILRSLPSGEKGQFANPTRMAWREINIFFYSFENSNDLTSRAFRLERVEPEDIDSEEARVIEEAGRQESA